MNWASDLDGTITVQQSSQLLEDHLNKKITTAYLNKKLLAFTPNKGTELISKLNLSPIIITGRQEPLREVTEFWLMAHNIPHSGLIMMPHGSFSWNKYMLYKVIEHKKRNLKFALDDNASVVAALNSVGIRTYQVTNDYGAKLTKALEQK